MYTIRLSDGTTLENLRLNGNNFISQTPITSDMFAGKLKKVWITCPGYDEGEEITQELNNVELVAIQKYPDGYNFILREIPSDELEQKRIKGDIEYIAMMSDIELEG